MCEIRTLVHGAHTTAGCTVQVDVQYSALRGMCVHTLSLIMSTDKCMYVGVCMCRCMCVGVCMCRCVCVSSLPPTRPFYSNSPKMIGKKCPLLQLFCLGKSAGVVQRGVATTAERWCCVAWCCYYCRALVLCSVVLLLLPSAGVVPSCSSVW